MKFIEVLKKALSPASRRNRGGWYSTVREPFAGAWQQNREQATEDILAYPAVFSCISLIAGDIAKLPIKLTRRDENNIWIEVENPAYSPVLRKPNHFQTRQQFIESWVISLLTAGNVYILKKRDGRGVVVSLYVLNPAQVTPLVADNGAVFYECRPDNLVGTTETVTVPASEIIHDRTNTLYHNLIGVPAIYAAALPVLQGREGMESAISFFRNSARPSGILQAPGAVDADTVEQIRNYWAANYTRQNAGRVAVLADGLTYRPFEQQNFQTAQLLETLRWTAETVAAVFHVPAYKIGAGEIPTSGNIESENIRYFSEALGARIEAIEALLSEGLGLAAGLKIEIDTKHLLRMDSVSLIQAEAAATGAGIKTINESRAVFGLPPLEGGDTAYMQQQYWPLQNLANRRDGPEGSTNRYFKTLNKLKEIQNAA